MKYDDTLAADIGIVREETLLQAGNMLLEFSQHTLKMLPGATALALVYAAGLLIAEQTNGEPGGETFDTALGYFKVPFLEVMRDGFQRGRKGGAR